MKAIPFVLALSGLLACKKNDASPAQSFDLVYQQPTTITASGPVQATLTTINESRCPSDVVCITGGTVAVTVTFTGAGPDQTARLGYDRSYARDSVLVTLNRQAYWLRLLAVTPYPSTKNASQPRTATLQLRPQ
ncbi:hypothetical protein A0257_15870 [Hymenobacter psoromatis]|nr:hypothetical protein A0257_15870 [Hymenobacter psoromatis]